MKVAHRYSWELLNGPIPFGKVIRHKCDVRNCVNPAHLEIGTQLDNVHDTFARGRANTQRGDQISKKLTSAQVIEILQRFKTEDVTYADLAVGYGVSECMIKLILSRKRWKHLPFPRHYRRQRYAKLAAAKL